MAIFDQVSEDIKKAMLAREKTTLEALRGIKKELLEAKTSAASAGNLTDETALKVIAKMVKRERDAAQIFKEQGRDDLYEEYMAQAAVYARYLPQMMSREEVQTAIAEVIKQVGAASPKDMGKVMGVATKQLAGKAEGRLISEVVKEMLASL